MTELYKPLGLKDAWNSNSLDTLKDESRNGIDTFLNDTIIQSAQLLLKQKFPHLQGLEYPSTFEHVGFKSIDPSKPFIQIANDHNHWVVLSNITGNSEISDQMLCYNSLVSFEDASQSVIKFSDRLKVQVCQLYQKFNSTGNSANQIIIKLPSCQQQSGRTDWFIGHCQQFFIGIWW